MDHGRHSTAGTSGKAEEFNELQLDEIRKRFGGDQEESPAGDVMIWLRDMPLVSVLYFQPDALPTPVDEMIDDLLNKVHKQ